MKDKLRASEIAIGQIRKLDSIKGIASSRLVAIAEIDTSDATCLVFLLGNAPDAATPRDVVISNEISKLPYDMALMSDYLSRADQGRLIDNPVLGQLNQSLIQAVKEAIIESPYGALKLDEPKYSVSVGNYPAQKYDAVWSFRDAEAENFALLTFVRNKTSIHFALKFYETNVENFDAFCNPEVPFDAIRLRGLSSERIEVAA